jgi:hypothetical protein
MGPYVGWNKDDKVIRINTETRVMIVYRKEESTHYKNVTGKSAFMWMIEDAVRVSPEEMSDILTDKGFRKGTDGFWYNEEMSEP